LRGTPPRPRQSACAVVRGWRWRAWSTAGSATWCRATRRCSPPPG